MFKIELGMTVRDILTGYTGVVTSRVDYITGCNRYGVIAISKNNKDNKLAEVVYFDEDRCILVDKEQFIIKIYNKGGDQSSPKMKETPNK